MSKKLVRDKIVNQIHPSEYYVEKDVKELQRLTVMKVKEELAEVIDSDFEDVEEFADLIDVVLHLANISGYTRKDTLAASQKKKSFRGGFSNIILTNLNPNNPSNKMYFDNDENS